MLTFIRSLARSPLLGGVIIAFLVAAFALWGINDIFRGTGNAAVLVGTERVTVQDVARVYERQLLQIQRENPRFTREQAEEVGLGENVVAVLTTQAALDAKTTELGLAVSDAALVESIETIPAFQNPFTNRFDRQAYLSVLSDNGYVGRLAERQFEAELTDEMRRNQFIDAAIGGLTAPAILAQARRAYEEERRSLRALLIPPSLAGEVGEPDDVALEAFIAENARVFQRAEQRAFTVVRVSPDQFLPDVRVAEQDLQDLYDFRLETGDLTEAPTRSLTQWAALDSESAETAASRIGAGEAAGAVAAELGLGEAVALSEVEAFQVPETEIAEAAFAMAAGEVRAVQGRLGWRVVRIDAAVDPETPSFEAMRAELTEELAGDEAEGRMLDALAAFEEARGAGATLEEAAASANLPAERFDLVGANGFTAEGTPAVTLAQAPELMATIFELPVGFAGDLESLGGDGYFVARVDASEPSRLPTVDEVREQASAFWRIRQVDEALQAAVDDTLTRANAGESLDAIAAALGPQARVEAATLARDETAGPFHGGLVGSAFAVQPGAAFAGRSEDQRTRAIVVVDAVIPVEPTLLVDRSGVSEELADDLARMTESALLASYTVRPDQRLIDQALGRIDPNLQ